MPERSYETRSLADRVRARALATVVRARLVIAPVLGSFSLTFAFFEPTPWRRLALASAVALLFGLSLIEWLRYRKYGPEVVHLPVNVLLTALGQLLIASATGGLLSPAVAAVVVLVLLSGVIAEPRVLGALLGFVIPCWWSFALVHAYGWPVPSLLPALFGGAQPIEHGPAPWLAATLLTLIVSMAARVGSGVQQLSEELFSESMRERDRALALHAEQSRALTTLTGEIAHELKNPLSSVKGLAALVAKDLDGRAAERVAVLRQEVDRMQAILEEFLNFSRPLVPLSLVDVDLAELAREVARLHEGSALERGVELALEADEVHLRADMRKIRQVLINLLQNALDASPSGTTITLSVASQGARVRLTVRDRGPGIAAALLERVFDAGVTQKEHGSGLGLALARSLARQHGGELSLRNHPQGGAIAELTLPREPPGVGELHAGPQLSRESALEPAVALGAVQGEKGGAR